MSKVSWCLQFRQFMFRGPTSSLAKFEPKFWGLQRELDTIGVAALDLGKDRLPQSKFRSS